MMAEKSSIPGTIGGSNNLTLPIDARVRERLNELKTTGKNSFRKGEDGEWMDFPAENPVSGPLTFSQAVSSPGKDVLELKYSLFKTVKNNEDKIVVATYLRKAGPGDSGTEEKIIDCTVIERFEKKKPFETKIAWLKVPKIAPQSEESKLREEKMSEQREVPSDEEPPFA